MIQRQFALIGAYQRIPIVARISIAIGWAALIWWSSSQPAGTGKIGFWMAYLHNGTHIVIFGVLATLIQLCFVEGAKHPAVFAFAMCLAYGIGDEIHQMYVPGRYASVLDVVSDCIGAALFVAALVWLRTGQRNSLILTRWLIPASLLSALLATLY